MNIKQNRRAYGVSLLILNPVGFLSRNPPLQKLLSLMLLVIQFNRNFKRREQVTGQRVVTFKDIDELHQRVEGTALRNFKENRKYFIEGEDYFEILRADVGTKFVPTYGFDKKAPKGYLITETGYLMLVKSFKDDLAWAVQRTLVNSYFKGKINPMPKDYLEACGVIKPVRVVTDREIAEQFLNSIQKALESGEYYLLPKYEWDKEKQDGILLGIYDDTVITLISSRVCEIYTKSIDMPLSAVYIANLRKKLSCAGILLPRVKKDGKRRIKSKYYCVMRIKRQAADAISGFRVPLLIGE